ncbi:hypothetical protein G7050_11565 [Dysgonomonas sp. HDW5A]|uniref:hypothetical protein n=1 Tax=Dysgonomonas sp. HDW5A TaxID=2714926 RepID=UPI00140DA469|nr:hypothetical protein [Dysgonomonas sp. HDW5A]QIK60428.1 hypothetical protein G7050_11565 [Dysgonomonas sp. HDW5A]
MKKIVTFFLLSCLLVGCGLYQTAQVDKISLGMNKQEVLSYLKSGYGKARTASARKLDDGSLEESIELTENYDKYTFIFIDGILSEWYTVDIRTYIPPAPIIQSTTSSETK